MLLLVAVPAALAADPFAGLEFAPFSRADLTWVDEERTSGTGVGEFDGVVAPSLTAFGGAWLGRFGLSGALGIARLQSTTWTGEVYRQRHWGVLRPSIDARWALTERALARPVPWLLVGAHGDVPSARDVSNGYTTEEQEAADVAAYEERLRLGGFGGRAGAGVDLRLREGLAIGALYAIEGHWGVIETDDASVVSSWVGSRAALLLQFEW